MSWDFSLEVDVGGEHPAEVWDGPNYTYNVAPMYRLALSDDNGIRSIDGKRADGCVPILKHAICVMEASPDQFRALNPENGWGNYEGALKILKQLLDACQKMPKATMRVI